MNRLLILIVIAIIGCFNALCKELEIVYNEYTDQEYSITYKTIEDTPFTVEIIRTYFKSIVDLVEIPKSIIIDEKEYTVTRVNTYWGAYSSPSIFNGPKKIIFPSTIRRVSTKGETNRAVEEIVFNDSPIEEMGGFGLYYNLKLISFGNAFKAKSIGNFYSCESLVEIDIPESVKEIDEISFQKCHSLRNVTLPSSLTTIQRESFAECSSLEKIEFKGTENSQCSYVGNAAFRNCESLTSISLPKATTIENEAFLNCTSLSSVILSKDKDNEINIGSHAFDNCTKLNDIQYEVSQLQSIGENAFKDCTSLETFTFPSDCRDIGQGVFAGCTGMEAFQVIGVGNLIVKDGVLMQKSEWDEYLYLIAYPAGKKDQSYIMPEEVVDIYGLAFEGALYLQDLTLSSKMTYIGEGLFRNADNLYHIYGGENIQRIGNGAFEGASNLQDVSLLKNVTELGVMVFRGCKSLKRVELPEGLNHIPSGTFMGCTALEDVKIPDNYIYIGKSSFQDCSSLKGVKLPDELMVLGESAFINCKNIESIHLPKNVTEIRTNTFRDCEALESITLPLSLDTIHSGAFQGCKTLRSFELPTVLKELGERAFKACESLTILKIPDNVMEIGTNAFEDCSSLKEVTVGNGVKNIGQWAFYDCKAMEKLTLGSSLESIGAEAFDGDVNLRDITCLSVNPPSFPGGFPLEVMENATVTVPAGSEDAYNSDPNWDPMVEGEVQKTEEILLNYSEIELNIKESVTLTAKVLPESAVNKNVTWSSDDYYVAKVDENGVVTAKDSGIAVITASCGNVTAECVVKVIDPNEVKIAEEILLNFSEIELPLNESVTLTAEVLPEDAVNKEVTWTSDNYSVARVDENGVVTAMNIGIAVITAMCGNVTAECIVSVIEPEGVDPIESATQKSLDIFDTHGRLLRSGVGKDILNNMPSGLYIIRTGDKIQKFIVK